MQSLNEYTIWLPTLTLVIVRVFGIFLAAPVLGESAMPWKLRYAAAIAIALAVVSRMAVPVSLPGSWIELLIALGGELLVGAAIGYAARLVFAGVELAAFHVAQQLGVALAEVYSPVETDASGMLRQLFRLLALVLFLAVGGHRVMIAALLATFQSVPLLGFTPTRSLLSGVADLLGASFVLGLKVAAPVLLAMLLATVALGMLQKSIPQCNVLTVGLPVRALLGLLAMAGALAVMPGLVESAWKLTFAKLPALLAGA